MTGTSKGVVMSHGNFILVLLMVMMDQDGAGEKPNMFQVFGLPLLTATDRECVGLDG